ncbi:MAG: ABC transporter ATP-binding protein [Acidimicrobiia bacterium]
MGAVIEIEGLRKEYRRRGGRSVAVDGLDLTVPEGGVFGFCGPNGSGKTTTIRCLLGLVRPSGGRLRLLGRPVPGGLADAARSVGAIVEAPAMFPTMTGRENLRLLGAIDGIPPARVDDLLDELGLAAAAGDAVRKYSLGMRQRLGLAAALLKDPALVVLDEPANGLDPAGIAQVRVLLRRLGAEGRTVFVSSHQLQEVEVTCDRVAILSRGRLVETGPVADVLGAPAVLARVADPAAGLEALGRAGLAAVVDGDHLRVDLHPDRSEEVSRALGARGLWVRELRPVRRSLEERFFELTGDAGPEPGEAVEREAVPA